MMCSWVTVCPTSWMLPRRGAISPAGAVSSACHVRFGSGGGVGDRPADHDLGCALNTICPLCQNP